MQVIKMLRWFSIMLIAVIWVGCERQPDGSASETPEALAVEPSPEALVILAKADVADGSEDMVVDKCLTCSLGMAGEAEYAVTFGPYELHLCSDACRNKFKADPEQAVLAVKLPESPE